MTEIKHQIPNRPPVPSLGSGVEDLRLEAASTPGFFGLGLYNVGLRQPGPLQRSRPGLSELHFAAAHPGPKHLLRKLAPARRLRVGFRHKSGKSLCNMVFRGES